MARKKTRSRSKNSNRSKTRSPQKVATHQKREDSQQVMEIKAAHNEAMANVTEDDLTAIGNDPRPKDADLDALWEIVREARDIYRSAAKRAEVKSAQVEKTRQQQEEQARKLDKKKSELDERTKSIEERARDLDKQSKHLEERETELALRNAELTDRETDLKQRELNAEVGFVKERDAMLAKLKESAAALRVSLSETEQDIAKLRAAWQAEERTARARLQEDLETERQAVREDLAKEREVAEADVRDRLKAIQEKETKLADDRRVLESEKRRLSYEEEDLKELRADLEARVNQRAAALREDYEHRIAGLEAQLKQARADRDYHQEVLMKREDADRRFGQRTPDEVLAELDELRAKRDELQSLLAERPDSEATTRLADLERKHEAWHAERIELRRQVSDLKRRLAYFESDANEREVQRDLVKSLENQRQLLFEAHRQIRAEIDDLLSRADAKAPFPACSAMDQSADLQSPIPMLDSIDDLKDFVADLQVRIAFDPDHPERRLYYTLADLRSFLGGLAMSQLVLLQGISGTGKTSLPVAFARAVGPRNPRDNTLSVVEVQAGWRDPQDLVGHYNAFKNYFDERDFIKALYRAQTPRWEDALHIVVLDEMNLSHPEQYFSDLLSALELTPENRRLDLRTPPLDPVPARFVGEDRNKLPIPPNVWFVGTVNHDETTKDFADKTYDRSHVMEFPHRPPQSAIEEIDKRLKNHRPKPRSPISFGALQRAFDDAVGRHKTTADRAISFLEAEVRESLANYFEVGWGPRLERQMWRYVPVVVAAGGSVGEATDHVLAMRLLRKLKNRHDNRPEHIEALRQRIKETWPALDKSAAPTRSLDLLLSELRRLGREPESSE